MTRFPCRPLCLAALIPLGCGTETARFDAARLLEDIEVLASDEFGGRAPASPGEQMTIGFLTGAFESLGLEPGNPDGGWLQAVPLLGSTATTMEASSNPGGGWEPAVDFVAWTKRVVPAVEAEGELLFVGYGVEAPEYGWDDFGDADLAGKILVVLVNDPPGEHHFGGEAMTYYGRWTYKYESAAAQIASQGNVFNPQQQRRFHWPATPVVARAYLDQLRRGDALSAAFAADLDGALDLAASALRNGGRDAELAVRLESLALAAAVASGADEGITATRRAALAETLGGIAAKLR